MKPQLALLPFLLFLPQQGSKPSSKPSSRPSREQPATPLGAQGSPRALYLAAKVVQYAGGFENWDKLRSVAFTFAGRRRLFWDRSTGIVRIEFPPKKGGQEGPILFYDTTRDRGWALGNKDPRLGQAAKGIFINDFYWLTVPFKVLDPGVQLALLPRAPGQAEGIARLRLRFASVGLTPNNQYVLHVEQKTGRIVRWDFFATPKASPRSWTFEGYVEKAGLRFSLLRKNVGKGPSLSFTELKLNLPRPDGFLTRGGRIL